MAKKDHSLSTSLEVVSQPEMGPSPSLGTETFLSTVHIICKPISPSESVGAEEEHIPVHSAVRGGFRVEGRKIVKLLSHLPVFQSGSRSGYPCLYSLSS